MAIAATQRDKDIRRDKLKEILKKVSETGKVTCPNCGSTEGTWGVVAARGGVWFAPNTERPRGQAVISYRCNQCGHLQFFSEPPTQTVHKDQPLEASATPTASASPKEDEKTESS